MPGYFLIVQDFMQRREEWAFQWARSGFGSESAVAYCTGTPINWSNRLQATIWRDSWILMRVLLPRYWHDLTMEVRSLWSTMWSKKTVQSGAQIITYGTMACHRQSVIRQRVLNLPLRKLGDWQTLFLTSNWSTICLQGNPSCPSRQTQVRANDRQSRRVNPNLKRARRIAKTINQATMPWGMGSKI